ncbi:MAG: SDR family oxidoreductase [Nitrospirae bacterium]|nr:SDR family oxidoreductase [Nitrospirota bacterium]
MKLLITGGFGYLGSWLTDYFCDKRYDVSVLSHSSSVSYDPRVQLFRANLEDAGELESVLKQKFDCCIHAGSINDSFVSDYARKALLVNALGTRNIIGALIKNGIQRFVYLSTFHVYGASEGVVSESSPLLPVNDYGITHLFGEYYVKQFHKTHGLPFTIIRPTNGYGAPKQIGSTKWYLLLNDLVRSAFEKGVIALSSNGRAYRDFIWLGDICRIVDALLVSYRAEGATYNVSTGCSHRLIDIAEIVKEVYSDRYKKEINISTNSMDQRDYSPITVSNDLLMETVKFQFQDRLKDEVCKIFDLLEKGVDRK